MAKKGIIFDMDGTLWDSAEGVAKSWSEVVSRKHAPDRVITTEEIKRLMGKTMDKIADDLFPELPAEQRMELMDRCCEYENEYLRAHGGILYPRLEETLQELHKQYHLYIVSNCQSGYIEAFLGYYGFEDYFEDIECYGNNGLKKGDNIRKIVERNKLTDSVYVGDIQGDYDASMEAGIKFIYAAYGFGNIKQDVPVIHEFQEILSVVSQVLQ